MAEVQDLKRAIHVFRGIIGEFSYEEARNIVSLLDLSNGSYQVVSSILQESFVNSEKVRNSSIVNRIRVELVMRGENLHI